MPAGNQDQQTRQCEKIREITDTLAASGCVSLDEQASVLGLPRSTTWAFSPNRVLCAQHKQQCQSQLLAAALSFESRHRLVAISPIGLSPPMRRRFIGTLVPVEVKHYILDLQSARRRLTSAPPFLINGHHL